MTAASLTTCSYAPPTPRAVLRVHKQVLALQNDTWRACMRNTVRVSDVDRSLDELEAATARANQVYKRWVTGARDSPGILHVRGTSK